jgi:hypothetical protein
MNAWLFWYTIFARGALAVAYVWLGSCIVDRVVARSPDAPVATHALNVNDKLTTADLQTDATAALVDGYLRAPVAQGKPVTGDNVSRTPIETKLTPSLAAIVPIKPETREKLNISKGSKVRIVFSGTPQELSGVVAEVNCDKQFCSTIVGLAKSPNQTFDAFNFAKADLVPDETTESYSP